MCTTFSTDKVGDTFIRVLGKPLEREDHACRSAQKTSTSWLTSRRCDYVTCAIDICELNPFVSREIMSQSEKTSVSVTDLLNRRIFLNRWRSELSLASPDLRCHVFSQYNPTELFPFGLQI